MLLHFKDSCSLSVEVKTHVFHIFKDLFSPPVRCLTENPPSVCFCSRPIGQMWPASPKEQGASFNSPSCTFRPYDLIQSTSWLYNHILRSLWVEPHLTTLSDMDDFCLHVTVTRYRNSYIGALVPDSGATQAEPHSWVVQFRWSLSFACRCRKHHISDWTWKSSVVSIQSCLNMSPCSQSFPVFLFHYGLREKVRLSWLSPSFYKAGRLPVLLSAPPHSYFFFLFFLQR